MTKKRLSEIENRNFFGKRSNLGNFPRSDKIFRKQRRNLKQEGKCITASGGMEPMDASGRLCS